MAKSKKDKDLELDETEITEEVIDEVEELIDEEVIEVEDPVEEEEVETIEDDVVDEVEEDEVEEVIEDKIDDVVGEVEYVGGNKVIKILPTNAILQSVLIWDGIDEVLDVDNYKRVLVTTGEVMEIHVPEGKLDMMLEYYESLDSLGLEIVK